MSTAAAALAGVQLVQIVPHGDGGVADCAQGLREAWHCAGVDSRILPLCRGDVRSLALAERLLALSGGKERGSAVVLHFSGYGYASRGLCGWLPDELRRARLSLGGKLRVLTLFHELFASGPPWRSAFWTGWPQARIAARLAQQSDAVRTNTEHHAQWLRRCIGSDMQVGVAPVFSNVGEGAEDCLRVARLPRMVVFGSAATRQRAFDGLAGTQPTLESLAIEQIVEVGPGPQARLTQGLPPRHSVGRLEPAELVELLRSSRYGLMEYPARHLGKSGVFAAYAANGCVAVNTSRSIEPADGLEAGRHYLGLWQGRGGLEANPPHLAEAAWAWYRKHSRELQGRVHLRTVCRLFAPGRSIDPARAGPWGTNLGTKGPN